MRSRVIALCIALVAVLIANAAEDPQTMERHRLIEQERATPKGGKSWTDLPIADGPRDPLNSWISTHSANRSVIQDDYVAHSGLNRVANGPGLRMATTTWDLQHNDAAPHQCGLYPYPVWPPEATQLTHFSWTHWDVIPESLNRVDRFVNFQTYSSGTGLFLHGGSGVTLSGAGGDPLSARAGFVTLDVDDHNRSQLAIHQRDYPEQPSGDFCSYYLEQSEQRFAVFTEGVLNGSKGAIGNVDDDAIWPHISVHRKASGTDYYYVLSHPYAANNNIMLWRWNGTVWQGPYAIDSCTGLSYNIAADPTSTRTALISETSTSYPSNPLGINQIYIRRSANYCDGFGPVNTSELGDANRQFVTNYQSTSGPGAWLEVVGDFDNAGKLHVAWNEQRVQNSSSQGSWKHWDDVAQQITTIHNAFYDNKGANGARDINIAYPTMGFGDGSTTCGAGTNLNYVYLTFVQFGGTSVAEQADMSRKGYMNGEIYLTTSADGGIRWSPAKNLTNTQTPGCEPDWADSCGSENWPSLARLINDTIHIQYLDDKDAGDAVFSQGAWTWNPVMYYRIPGGTNVQPVCPLIAPNASAELTDANGPDCEYNTPPGTGINEALRLSNVGNAAMAGAVSKTYIAPPTGTWLSMTTGSYNIAVGGADLSFPVTMNAASLSEGLYQARINVTHNDPTKLSPFQIPIDFFVFNNFACPQWVVLRTKWLELEISSAARVAAGPLRAIETESTPNAASKSNEAEHEWVAGISAGGGTGRLRGLYRNPVTTPSLDSGNNSIYDASLFIARPPTDLNIPPDGVPDTIVYRYVFGQGYFSKGFRPLSSLTVDTSKYGTGGGMVRARANLTTVDSIIGIDVEYQFPQHTDSSNFVIVSYKLFNRTGWTTFTNLIIGECVDFDVVPSSVNAKYQSGSSNLSGTNASMNLVYQQGCDTGTTALAKRYLGGITAIQCTQSPRAWTAANADKLFPTPGGGFYEGYLYRELVKSGFEVIPPGSPGANGGADLHSVISFEKNVNLTPTTVKHYMMGFVTSTAGPTDIDLIGTTKKAWKYAFGWQEFVSLDTLPVSAPASYPYWASGSHEAGVGSGCCGCVITEVSDPSSKFSITPGATPCEGTIYFAGAEWAGTHTATFRLATPPGPACGGPYYIDDQVVTIEVVGTPEPKYHLWFSEAASFAAGSGPISIAAYDLNGDGKRDLATANYNQGTVSVLLNQGNGTFGAPTNIVIGRPNPVSIVTVQLDGNGSGDIAVVSETSGEVSVLRNRGDATFDPATHFSVGSQCRAICAGDFDLDSDQDLAVVFGADQLAVLRNNGTGGFTTFGVYSVGHTPSSVTAAWLNADGRIDLAVADAGDQNVAVLKGNGDGTFTAAVIFPAGISPRGIVAADVNLDGRLDLVVSNDQEGGIAVLRGTDPLSFAAPVKYATGAGCVALVAADLDGNGSPDVATANELGGTVTFLQNLNNGTLGNGFPHAVGANPRSLVAHDLNMDGRLDLAVANWQSDNVSVLLNDGPNCDCTMQGDVDYNSVIDVFDVIGVVGIAFSGEPDPQDPGCPRTRGDADFNGLTDVFDVIYLIATAFSGGPEPVNPCGP